MNAGRDAAVRRAANQRWSLAVLTAAVAWKLT